MLFKRLLVANRGEIAIRIFRAATELDIRTYGIYSYEDRFSHHRYKADEAYRVGTPGEPMGGYLNIEEIIELAKRCNVDAIHPGYGFLSENADFARACKEAGIVFVGPGHELLDTFGDKVKAKKAAKAAGIRTVPGSDGVVENIEEAKKIAKEIGYPIILKALSGGGGRGIRLVNDESCIEDEFTRAISEAKSSFGVGAVYIEKTIINPKHIEVQILGDSHGNLVHLFERDCSVQRRHQKVVEVAPALGISQSARKELHDFSVKLGKSVGYMGAGTVEFLVTEDGTSYFLEVNPRIQVEHTVTEMITGIDIAQSSIAIAAGEKLSHPVIGIKSQDKLQTNGVAFQCRITTEDPKNNFAPDFGKVLAYRPGMGFGIRLDGGTTSYGAEISPHYDSLLVKVTAFAPDLYAAARKMLRGLKEFRLRGIKSNIPLLLNIVSHPKFYDGTYNINFLDEHPEVFEFTSPKDRATKVLRYLAEATVNNPHDIKQSDRATSAETVQLKVSPAALEEDRKRSAKDVFDKEGVDGLVKWIKSNKQLLLTDTTMRDAHQSLFATRMRTRDILKSLDYYRVNASSIFSLEMWGGATFDTSLRFLKEDPWERLHAVREKVPNTLLQMLIRGDNAVGYTNYPKWVVEEFIRLSVEAGMNIFRIFDCLNNKEQMAVSIAAVKKHGAIAEASVCYSGNVSDKKEDKYTLDYYLDVVSGLVSMGIDILCIKDMAGLLRPTAAKVLIDALKQKFDIPIHLHTHATSGNSVATVLAASEAGCDIVDGAVSSMSGFTSQPSLNALVASLEGTPRESGVTLKSLDQLAMYWESVRTMYQAFDPGIKATSTRVYEHEIPGGQYSNLYDQARRVGVSAAEFYYLTELYRDVNQLFGNIVKVTPSSKVIGDMALLLQKQGLDTETLMKKRPQLDYPDSVLSFFKGHMGVPYQGFPEDIRTLVLGENPPKPQKVIDTSKDTLASVSKELSAKLEKDVSDEEAISYRLYPKVYLDYRRHLDKYSRVDSMPTKNFFYGLKQNEEIEFDLEPGKTLYISNSGISEPDQNGYKTVFWELNGYPRPVKVLDESLEQDASSRRKADPDSDLHVAATMPGKVLEVLVKPGANVKNGDTLLVTESMKMEYAITAKLDGTVDEIFVSTADQVESGDLLATVIAK